MASVAQRPSPWRIFFEPLRGVPLIACGIAIWLAGAAYCHGYQHLLAGESPGPWSGSLIWSAVAVVPWFALFEWSKQGQGVDAAASGSGAGACARPGCQTPPTSYMWRICR